MLNYVFIFFCLGIALWGYILVANKIGIIDQPNLRSSHDKPTVRGAGIIIPLSVLLWGILFFENSWLIVISIILIGIIGFIDDIYEIKQLPKFIVQSISVSILVYHFDIHLMSLFLALMIFVLITGWLNAFNFMDGINGISALYALSVIIGIGLFRNYVTQIPISLLNVVIVAILLFSFVNVRSKALAFAGDVGSLTLGLLLSYFIVDMVLSSGKLEFILLVAVYGVDSVATIIYRIIKGENIFTAHRSHLYQLLANKLQTNHVLISLIYATTQLLIIFGLSYLPSSLTLIYSIAILMSLSISYIVLRRWIETKVTVVG